MPRGGLAEAYAGLHLRAAQLPIVPFYSLQAAAACFVRDNGCIRLNGIHPGGPNVFPQVSLKKQFFGPSVQKLPFT